MGTIIKSSVLLTLYVGLFTFLLHDCSKSLDSEKEIGKYIYQNSQNIEKTIEKKFDTKLESTFSLESTIKTEQNLFKSPVDYNQEKNIIIINKYRDYFNPRSISFKYYNFLSNKIFNFGESNIDNYLAEGIGFDYLEKILDKNKLKEIFSNDTKTNIQIRRGIARYVAIKSGYEKNFFKNLKKAMNYEDERSYFFVKPILDSFGFERGIIALTNNPFNNKIDDLNQIRTYQKNLLKNHK